MIYLLDANACVGWLRRNEPKLVARIQREDPANIVLCSVVVAELIYGAERSGPSHRFDSRTSFESENFERISHHFPSMIGRGKRRGACEHTSLESVCRSVQTIF